MAVARPPARPDSPPLPAGCDLQRAREVIGWARRDGRRRLLETEGRYLLEAIGIEVPRAAFVPALGSVTGATLAELRGDRLVVKLVADGVVHKTEVGGVAIVDRAPAAVEAAMNGMAAHLVDATPIGYLVSEYVEHGQALGGELLVSARWMRDLGPVVSVGAGGIHAEAIAADLRPGAALAVVGPGLTRPDQVGPVLAASTAVRLASEAQRGRPPLLELQSLVRLTERLLAFAAAFMPGDVVELEVNPLAVTPSGLVALDVMVVLGDPSIEAERPIRPTWKLRNLLEPRSMAIAGVSSGENPGRTILRNVLRDGFDPAAVTVVKPGVEQIEGCRCVDGVADLPVKVDLLVVALAARPAAALVIEAIERDAAESVIVIPGGLEEKTGGADLAARMRTALAESRRRPGGGPLVNGGNCLGIRSRPGSYDTLFIPESRLAGPTGHPAPLALIAQSGAFSISRLSRLENLDPKYVISVGNQMDLTLGDYLDHLAGDREVDVVGVYAEGLAPLDGPGVLAAARAIRERGGSVVLYLGGRTTAGAGASASHTASIAGNATVIRALADTVGIVVADTLDEFDDLVATLTSLAGRTIDGPRLGAVSNAGFECVAIGDNLGTLRLAAFDEATNTRLSAILRETGAGDVVDVHNPVDLTPMAGDAAFGAAAAAVLDCPAVDVGIIGNVPFTPALRTMSAAADGAGVAAPETVAAALLELWRRSTKAWITVVDAGPRYDPLAEALGAGGIPTFRTADRALRTLEAVVRARLRGQPRAGR